MKKRRMAGLAALCLVSGSGWILDQVAPEVLQGPLRAAAHEGLLAILFGLASVWSKSSSPRRAEWRVELKLAGLGIALFAIPLIVITAAAGTVASLTEILIFTLSPAIVVFLIAQSGAGFGDQESPLSMLLPALGGFGGAALLLPFTWPATPAGEAWLAAIVAAAVLSASASVRLHRVLTHVPLLRAVAIVCGATAIVSAAFSGVGWAGQGSFTATAVALEVARCLLVDGPIVFLTIWLLREIEPVNAASRYLFVPLITIVEGYVIERPTADWTVFAGGALMASAATMLLLSDTERSRDLIL